MWQTGGDVLEQAVLYTAGEQDEHARLEVPG